MTQITRDDVIKLASLSSLQLGEDEITHLQSDLATLIGYVEQLDEIDTTGVEPVYQVTGLLNVLREDVVDEGTVQRESLLALAADTTENQIKVPKVL